MLNLIIESPRFSRPTTHGELPTRHPANWNREIIDWHFKSLACHQTIRFLSSEKFFPLNNPELTIFPIFNLLGY